MRYRPGHSIDISIPFPLYAIEDVVSQEYMARRSVSASLAASLSEEAAFAGFFKGGTQCFFLSSLCSPAPVASIFTPAQSPDDCPVTTLC